MATNPKPSDGSNVTHGHFRTPAAASDDQSRKYTAAVPASVSRRKWKHLVAPLGLVVLVPLAFLAGRSNSVDELIKAPVRALATYLAPYADKPMNVATADSSKSAATATAVDNAEKEEPGKQAFDEKRFWETHEQGSPPRPSPLPPGAKLVSPGQRQASSASMPAPSPTPATAAVTLTAQASNDDAPAKPRTRRDAILEGEASEIVVSDGEVAVQSAVATVDTSATPSNRVLREDPAKPLQVSRSQDTQAAQGGGPMPASKLPTMKAAAQPNSQAVVARAAPAKESGAMRLAEPVSDVSATGARVAVPTSDLAVGQAAPATATQRAGAAKLEIITVTSGGAIVMNPKTNMPTQVRIGGALPNGQIIVSANPKDGVIETASGSYRVQ